MKKILYSLSVFTCLILGLLPGLFAQSLPSSQLYHELLKIKETNRVLYVAAHPDDENTRLIAYLANDSHAQVAYLSLTRGDGGQNLIGKELGVELGQIRTQELLRARETDGGRQFFTRATDFGYSKNPDETLQNWEKQKILSDVVWVIRKFQPDIIITRFNTIPGVTHGHHTTSAILAGEAFSLAGNPEIFPEQLKYVDVWAPKRLFWNTYNFRSEFEPEEGVKYAVFPVGEFNPLLGETYSQISADSRTMHKSQGFGSTASIGEAVDHIQFMGGDSFNETALEGVKDRWQMISGGAEIKTQIEQAIEQFDFKNPMKVFPLMMKLRADLYALEESPIWVKEKQNQIDQLILNLMGVEIEVNSNSELTSPGEELKAELVLNNPSKRSIGEISLELLGGEFTAEENESLNNQPVRIEVSTVLPEDQALSQPYWLEKPIDGAMYQVDDQMDIGKAFNEPTISAMVSFQLDGQAFSYSIPVNYKVNDRVDGEVKQPLTVVPKINLSVSKESVFLIEGVSSEVTVTVDFQNQIVDGDLDFENLEKSQFKILSVTDIPFQMQRVYTVSFTLYGEESRFVTARYTTSDGKSYNQTTNRILYKHIPNLTYFSPASLQVTKANWKVSGDKIGYIPGAGDEIPEVLEALGYEVSFLDAKDYTVENLSQYKAIVVGIRAYNTNETLAGNQQILMGYVRAGGNVISQYNTSSGLLTNQLGPYDFSLSRTRVTVQGSPVQADYNHPLLASPNQMNERDFAGWVQERGLYFVTDIDERYDTPLTMNEPGESPTNGSLVYAKYGEGTFIYTGISLFRQLPAGVTGATKLFVNMIEQ